MASGSSVEQPIETQLNTVANFPITALLQRTTFFHASTIEQPSTHMHLPTSKEEPRLWKLELILS